MTRYISLENHPNDSRIRIIENDICYALSTRMGTGGNNVPLVLEINDDEGDDKLVCGVDVYNQATTGSVSMPLRSKNADSDHVPVVLVNFENDPTIKVDTDGVAFTLRSREYKDPQCVLVKEAQCVVALEGNGSRPSHRGSGYSQGGVMFTLNSIEVHGVAYETKGDETANGSCSDS